MTFDTGLGSFTWSSGGTLSNYGTAPIFNTVANSNVVTTYFPNHGMTVGGDPFYVLNVTQCERDDALRGLSGNERFQ